MHRISFYVPVADAAAVKDALFAAGAGRIGAYDQCSWDCPGRGQFRPLEGADPAVGSVGGLEAVEELKVETVCEDVLLEPVLRALVSAHPYEEPAYAAWPVTTLADF